VGRVSRGRSLHIFFLEKTYSKCNFLIARAAIIIIIIPADTKCKLCCVGVCNSLKFHKRAISYDIS